MMPITHMVQGMENNVAAQQLIKLWEHTPGTVKFWRASSNFVYRFERDGVPFYLRFIQAEDNRVALIQAELDFVRYLSANGYPVAAPVLSLGGRWVETIRVPVQGTERGYHGVVFEAAQGESIPPEQMSDTQLEAWGAALASLHLLSDSYKPGNVARGDWNDALAFVATVLERHPHEAGAQLELKRVRRQLGELPAGPGLTGLIHYDFQPDNLFYSETDARFCAIDFDDAMIHWYGMDIAAALADLTEPGDEPGRHKIERFVTGYRTVRPLDERISSRLPLFRSFAQLYSFARLLRSLEHEEPAGAPEWARKLREKLLRYCDGIRTGYDQAATLRPINAGNWYACTQLSVTDKQKSTFPVPPVYWLAEAAFTGMNPLAIYKQDQLVGMAVHAVDPEDGSCWIMAYMIDRNFQRLGIGRSGMETLIRHLKETQACSRIRLGHRPENDTAAGLYASLGFVEVRRDDREIILELQA